MAVREPPHTATSHLVIENVGQYSAEARFLLKQGNQHIWVTDDAVWLTVPDPVEDEQLGGSTGRAARRGQQQPATLSGTALRFTFGGTDGAARLEPFGRVATRVSYLIGSDPTRWQRDVPVWSGVRYRDLYPGIDLVIGGDATGTIPWRLEARAGADVSRVALQVEGAAAAAAGDGPLRLDIRGRGVDLALPAWAMEGRSDQIRSTVVRQAGDDAFVIAPSSQHQDAVESAAGMAAAPHATGVVYSTYLGGSAWDAGYAIAVDSFGSAYVTGETDSTDFPGAPGDYTGGTDAFVAKVDNTGSGLIYTTYLGGSGLDIGGGIAVNGTLAHVVGETNSSDFPGAPGGAGDSDLFIAALNANGNDILYASLLGGSGFDTGTGVALDGTGAYVVGSTNSTEVGGTTGCANSSNRNVLVARFNAAGALTYATCFGGSQDDEGYAIAVRNETAYVTGESDSVDFPGTPPQDGWPGAGDILVAGLGANGALLGSTLIGGTGEDWGNDIAVDGDGSLYIAGATSSLLFPVTSGSSYGGGSSDAVILKLNGLLQIEFATHLGGNGEDTGYGIAVDAAKAFYVAGTTGSANFPVGTGALAGETDVFVARMHLGAPAPNKVTYATYLGGTGVDENYGVATDTAGNIFVTGYTESTDFPTLNGFGSQLGGASDGFVAKIATIDRPAAAAVVVLPLLYRMSP